MALSFTEIGPRLSGWVKSRPAATVAFFKKQLGREAWSHVFHVLLLLALIAIIRPMFFRGVPEAHYRSPFILGSMVTSDLSLIANAAKRHSPAISEVLHFLVPTLIMFLAKRRMRWTDWEHGKALRVFVMAVVIMLAWAGASFPYNYYLARFHGVDRIALVAFAALSWRYPIFVPFAVRWAIVMIKQSYVPIAQDDFDFRAPAEFAVVFSVFVWASMSKSFKPAHFLIAGLGSFASYYWSAGLAKWNFGAKHSWLLENHVSNLAVGGHVRGWASFLSDDTFIAFIEMARKVDRELAGYTLFIELGAVLGFFLHKRLTRWWLVGCVLLNLGIFMMSGVFFWKWMTLGFFGFFWMGRSGKPLIERMHEYKLPLLVGIASIYWANERIWYYPQTHVVWYDTRLTHDFELYAVGESGNKYLIEPNYFAPSDMHFTQGRLCYASDKARAQTGIYGTTGGLGLVKQLDKFATAEQGLAFAERGRPCHDAKLQAKFNDFVRTFFRNLNRGGRRQTWIDWIGRPDHLQAYPHAHLLDESGQPLPRFDAQEKVVSVEMWQNNAYHHGGKLHRSEPKLVHTVAIPK